MLGQNPNILRRPPAASLLGDSGLTMTVTVKPADLIPEPPQPGIRVVPEDVAAGGVSMDEENSFHDALALALGYGKAPPEQQAFWEWLQRTVVQNLDAFKDEELPYSILRWSKRA